MYRAAYQKGFLTVLYSVGSSPLNNWSSYTKNGYIKRIYDEDIKSLVLEIMGSNVSTTFIHCPSECKEQLGIKLPFLVLLIKNMHKYFCFEVKIQDDQRFMRRFRVSNFQSKTSVKPFCTAMPMGMSPGWNQIQFNLADFTRVLGAPISGNGFLCAAAKYPSGSLCLMGSQRLKSREQSGAATALFVAMTRPVTDIKTRPKTRPPDHRSGPPQTPPLSKVSLLFSDPQTLPRPSHFTYVVFCTRGQN
ncbi:GD11616 [Drosophila simulans]|uniref:GD11616 n=1 Tax=Drosophila simulans TaxID=7240 RepID=B4NVB5_DROSI|nr:GD11616 [Drosophila simulans]